MSAGSSFRTRHLVAPLATLLMLLSPLLAGGCAARTDGGWAQTAPAIPPVQPGTEVTRLGAMTEPVAMEKTAEEPVRN
jgi:hypothetical protein